MRCAPASKSRIFAIRSVACRCRANGSSLRRFDSCRGIYQGINAGIVDLALLRVIELYDRTLTREKLDRVLRETRERNGWLIFYTHDVADPPSWIGCSPRLLRDTIAAVTAQNMALPADPRCAHRNRLRQRRRGIGRGLDLFVKHGLFRKSYSAPDQVQTGFFGIML